MFQTATVTDLRFKNTDLIKKCRRGPVWIFKNGRRIAGLVNALELDNLLLKEKKTPKNSIKPEVTGNTNILLNLKKYGVKQGPKHLSKMINDIYG